MVDITQHEGYPFIIANMAMLSLFSVVGSLGNLFVIYVYARKRDKSTTTLFILTLAATDFFTCLVIIPYTILWDYFTKRMYNDAACRIYQFLITTNVPFSLSIMVAIAFDRYFKICRPLSSAMDERVAKRIIVGLLLFALSLGIIPSLGYEVYKPKKCFPTIDVQNITDVSIHNYTSRADQIVKFGVDNTENITFDCEEDVTKFQPLYRNKNVSYKGMCIQSERILSHRSRYTYQKFYASLFFVAFLSVAILYVFIFRSIVIRRKKLMKRKMANGTNLTLSYNKEQAMNSVVTCHSETTVATTQVLPGPVADKDCSSTEKTANKSTNTHSNDTELMVKTRNHHHNHNDSKRSRSKSIKEKQRIANTKTAVTLFTVTIVFAVAFLPAWLMAIKLIPFNYLIFYMYFSYNVANPFIYAFFNEAFRKEMRLAVQCRKGHVLM